MIGYFFTMFSTRKIIDEYTICFLANDIVHRLFLMFYSLGVFMMALNISFKESLEDPDYGSCVFVRSYLISFASAFLFTRMMMITLYLMHLGSKDQYKIEHQCKIASFAASSVIMAATFFTSVCLLRTNSASQFSSGALHKKFCTALHFTTLHCAATHYKQ